MFWRFYVSMIKSEKYVYIILETFLKKMSVYENKKNI